MYIIFSFILVLVSIAIYKNYESGWCNVIFKNYIKKKEKKKIFSDSDYFTETTYLD